MVQGSTSSGAHCWQPYGASTYSCLRASGDPTFRLSLWPAATLASTSVLGGMPSLNGGCLCWLDCTLSPHASAKRFRGPRVTQSVAVPLVGFPTMASDGLVAYAFRRASYAILTVFIPLACRAATAPRLEQALTEGLLWPEHLGAGSTQRTARQPVGCLPARRFTVAC